VLTRLGALDQMVPESGSNLLILLVSAAGIEPATS